jgi:hypothetical protein
MHGRDKKTRKQLTKANAKAMQDEVLLSAQGSGICNPFAFKKTCHLNVYHTPICVTYVCTITSLVVSLSV